MRLSVLLCCFVLGACTSDLPAACTEELLRCLSDRVFCAPNFSDKYKQAQEACAPASHVEEKILDLGPPKADWLFVIDNSRGMVAKQKMLAQKLAPLLGRLSAGADYHIGVISTDLGMNPLPGVGFPGVAPGDRCDSFAGDDGVLQARSCRDRTDLGPEARAACEELCPDGRFVPQDGARFLFSRGDKTNVPADLQLDQSTGKLLDKGMERALKCMMLLGDGGCELEAPLESARRALDGHRLENQGFLRPLSTLNLVFLSDEDDCSVPIELRGENDPKTENCPVADPGAPSFCFNPDFRCLASSVVCSQPLNTPGDKTECRLRADSYLTPVQSYVDFFRNLRPRTALTELYVHGLWGPRWVGGKSGFRVVQDPQGPTGSAGLNRAAGTEAACFTQGDPAFFARPTPRLSRFGEQLLNAKPSLCELPGATPGSLIETGISLQPRELQACLNGKVKRQDGRPLCTLGEVPPQNAHAAPDPLWGGCSPRCCAAWQQSPLRSRHDPSIQVACAAEPEPGCFCIVDLDSSSCGDGEFLGLWTKERGFDEERVINARCALQPL